ncbi:MAG TPA: hypothetical protein VEL06_06460 [Haliangiales bacterium]|nr:hypothetical protein [Haliangiales bacterium]
MHDIDSTRLETSQDHNEFEEYQEFESHNGPGELEMPMTEAEEEALAAELLGVSSELEMDQFLGGLFRKIKRGLGGAAKFLNQNAGPLAGALKGLAGKALPFLGGALGTAIPIPGVGTALGSALGRAASNLLQSELENLELEEQEFEMARRYVQLASQAMRQAARIPPRANPAAAINFALRNALQRMRGTGGFRPQPIYVRYRPCAPCPPPEPCPACPACAQPLPAGDSSPPAGNGDSGTAPTGDTGRSASGEFEFEEGEFEREGEFEGEREFEDTGEFEDAGEHEGEGEREYYETDNELFGASGTGGGRGGRWVRRGRKIVLYGL